jgi:DNA-binding Lrp family transcriptional regulator
MAVTAYILMTLRKGGEDNVAKTLEQLDGVMDVSELYGEFDIIAKVKKENMEELQQFLIRDIRSIKDVEQTSTMIAIK